MRWERSGFKANGAEQWVSEDNLFHVILTKCRDARGTATGWLLLLGAETTTLPVCPTAEALRKAEVWVASLAAGWLLTYRAEQRAAKEALDTVTSELRRLNQPAS